MTGHHPLRHIVAILDNWDEATEKAKQAALRLEHDLAGGVYDAIFDDESLLHMHGREHDDTPDDSEGLGREGDGAGGAGGGDNTA